MASYQYEQLNDESFQQLSQSLLVKEFKASSAFQWVSLMEVEMPLPVFTKAHQTQLDSYSFKSNLLGVISTPPRHETGCLERLGTNCQKFGTK